MKGSWERDLKMTMQETASVSVTARFSRLGFQVARCIAHDVQDAGSMSSVEGLGISRLLSLAHCMTQSKSTTG